MSVTFTPVGSGTAITISNPDLDDKLGLDPHQVVQPKASGGFYRFALAAVSDTTRELKWSNLRLSELNALTGFFNTVAQGALNEFTFTDERGATWAAYFLNPTLEPVTVADEQSGAAGTFASGGNTIPTTTRSNGWYELTVKLHLVAGTATTESATTFPPTTAMPSVAHTATPTGAVTTEPPAPEYVVSRAGTAAANGNYFTAGTANGKSYYANEAGGAYIWYAGGLWYIGAELGNIATAWYYGMALAGTPDATPYAINTGASPSALVAVG